MVAPTHGFLSVGSTGRSESCGSTLSAPLYTLVGPTYRFLFHYSPTSLTVVPLLLTPSAAARTPPRPRHRRARSTCAPRHCAPLLHHHTSQRAATMQPRHPCSTSPRPAAGACAPLHRAPHYLTRAATAAAKLGLRSPSPPPAQALTRCLADCLRGIFFDFR